MDGNPPDDTIRQNQKQLMLILHAHKCKRVGCYVNYCQAMRAVLAHMRTCRKKRDCTAKYCASSRMILLHYKTCKNSACIICYPFRRNHSVDQDANEDSPDR
ncbi:hypothetical protein KR074_004648 [Drosophila pseudoananassae]|nr:hypothetical protein KR074_004648 [Drosophila pseudoananassae]